jgi:hypothetical protein
MWANHGKGVLAGAHVRVAAESEVRLLFLSEVADFEKAKHNVLKTLEEPAAGASSWRSQLQVQQYSRRVQLLQQYPEAMEGFPKEGLVTRARSYTPPAVSLTVKSIITKVICVDMGGKLVGSAKVRACRLRVGCGCILTALFAALRMLRVLHHHPLPLGRR